MVSLVAKIENVIINLNWTEEIMAGPEKKLIYLEGTPWFPDYYIGWIGIGNWDQETSNVQEPSNMIQPWARGDAKTTR